MAKRATEQTHKRTTTNIIDAEKASTFFQQFEELEVERLARHSSYMGDMKSLREDKRQVRAAAKDAGIPPVVFDAEIAERAWERKREARLQQILAQEDAALIWGELRAFYEEDASFLRNLPEQTSGPRPLGPEDEKEDELL